ncbi:putative protein RCC2 isoform X1 [Iris pallida]|uniref:RCC1-like domain-containing protein n=1 Tax=Iris pallida TaxID=29817 RepID=A0AAX6G0S5_IRIPA|nr:putative protein RCC2 isoform X1 [Iris pallida]
MAAADTEKKAEEAEKVVSGELLYCGTTTWDVGSKTASAGANLISPTRLRSLVGVDIRFVAAGCSSCHCVALDVEGHCYTWGKNEKGQLGHGDTLPRKMPTVVSALSEYKIIKAGAGRNHTVVVTEDGRSFSFGMNKQGQLGTGSTRKEIELSPVPCLVSLVTNAVCGAEFTVWLSSVEGSSILTAGHPQYGQLGHGTDNEYNAKDSSVKLVYEAQPRPRAIATFSEKQIVKVACGANHTVAVDSSGYLYTWGYGGYGRLGHREQKDEWVPRLVEVFQRHNVIPPNAVVSASSVSSACTAGGGQLYMWGKIKTTGDDWMYPKPVMDLSGWNIRCMDSGNFHHFVGADDSCISWGSGQYGELGYGPMGQKSSANPKKVDILDGMHVTSVACGLGFSLVVVDRTKANDRLDKLEVYDGEPLVEAGTEAKVNGTVKPTKNAKKKGAVNSSKKRKKDSSDSEDERHESSEDEEEENDDTKTKSRRGGKASNRGRGRGSKKVASDVKNTGRGRGGPQKSEEAKSSGRGRGRPRKGTSGR